MSLAFEQITGTSVIKIDHFSPYDVTWPPIMGVSFTTNFQLEMLISRYKWILIERRFISFANITWLQNPSRVLQMRRRLFEQDLIKSVSVHRLKYRWKEAPNETFSNLVSEERYLTWYKYIEIRGACLLIVCSNYILILNHRPWNGCERVSKAVSNGETDICTDMNCSVD